MNKMNGQNTEYRCEGYTLVEMLVASVLFLAVLIPAMLFLGRITHYQKTRDTIVALNLARARMEQTLAWSEYTDFEKTEIMNRKNYLIRQIIEEQDGLAVIRVSVFREKSGLPLVTLSRLHNLR
ncbi:prepilin-type N-terminal cleavage/methylation domain-containing protein [bacterium]|nr:prepilin-type N-terminal cleavage/methylation domain-containing protein [bacterium]